MKSIVVGCLLASALSAAACAHAESAAASGAGQQMYSNLSNQMQVLRNAMDSKVANLEGRLAGAEGELASFKKCAANQKLYAPADKKADKDGCLAVAGGKSCHSMYGGPALHGQIINYSYGYTTEAAQCWDGNMRMIWGESRGP